MKNTKKLAAMIAALTLSACSIAPMFSFAINTNKDNLTTAGATAYEQYLTDNELEDSEGSYSAWLATFDEEIPENYFTKDDSGSTKIETTYTKTFTLTAPSSGVPDNAAITNVRAIQVFTLDVDKDNVTKYTASGWGSAIKGNEENFVNALKDNAAFVVDEANLFADVTYSEENDSSYGDIVSILGNADDDSAVAEAFAKAVINFVSTYNIDKVTPAEEYNEKNGAVTFGDSGLENGYYAFACDLKVKVMDGTEQKVENGSLVYENNNESVSLGMLTIVDGIADKNIGSADGVAKVGLPTVQKKVEEDDNTAEDDTTHEKDKHFNDGADWQIGQTKSFKLYGTLPDNYAKYEEYYYEFCDSLAPQFDAPTENMTIKINEDVTLTAARNGDGTWSVSAPENVDISNAGITVTVNEGNVESKDVEAKNHEINIAFDNLKDIKDKTTGKEIVNKETVIIVQYETKLNENAVVGSEGQENEVYLKYSNNPNQTGNGKDSPGETPHDKVIVFTYALEFNKKFWESSNLTPKEIVDGTYSGLRFKLTDEEGNIIKVKKYEDDDKEKEKYDYYITEDTDGLEEMELTLVDSDGKPVKGTPTLEDAKNYDLKIRIKGLDSDTYKIDEDGEAGDYNTDTNTSVEIKTAVKYQQNWDGTTKVVTTTDGGEKVGIYEQITYTFGTAEDKQNVKHPNTASGEIMNTKNSKLPSTGGIGTTIFYLGGGAMVAVAGVFLITKKRMGKQEN